MASSILDHIKHYQHGIEKYSRDEHKVLKCIDKLFHLDVTVQHLQETGVGRTVNALRKEPGNVGTAARALVNKWKLMVAAEESSEPEDHNHDATNYNGHGNGRDSDDNVNQSRNGGDRSHHTTSIPSNKEIEYRQLNGHHSNSKRKNTSSEDSEPDTKKSRNHKPEETDAKVKTQPQSESDQSDSNSDESDTSDSSDEDDKKKIKIKTERPEEYQSTSSKHSLHTNHIVIKKEVEDSSSKRSEVSKHHSRDSKSSSKDRSSSSHKSSKDKENSEKKQRSEHKSSDKDQSSSSKHSSSSERHRSTSQKHESSSEKHESSSEKHKRTSDKHDSKTDKHRSSSQSSKTVKEKTKSLEKDKQKIDQTKDSSSSKDRQSRSSKSKETINSSSKLKDKSSSSSKSKDTSSSKEKSSHSHSKSEKKHSSSDKSKSRSDKVGDSEKESKHKSSSSHKKSSSRKTKDDEPKKKSQSEDSDDGIDCGSGASFAEAIGMISPTKPKKKIQFGSKDLTSPYNTFEHDLGPAALLAPTTRLAPLPPLEISALPEISPNYRPRPPPKLLPHFTDEDAMSQSISSKNQRTKVYSGVKTYGKVPTLYEACVQVLQEHIEALEFTGGVPYEILKPVVDRATPQQLFMLEHYNPYLMDDTDHLWQKFCQKNFRSKQRQEMETWREMYMRCQEEQESKLKSLTANIRMTQEAKKAPIKQTKMAYVDTVVKPPRNIARKQALHGTARAAAASPAARVASLSSAPNVLRAGVSRPTALATPIAALARPKKAPLMQKALQFMRGRKR